LLVDVLARTARQLKYRAAPATAGNTSRRQ
jgi:hypothetical protein